MINISQIKSDLPNIEWSEDLPYYKFTSLGAGKVAPLVAKVKTDLELSSLLRYAKFSEIAVKVFSGGSNVLGMDERFNGIIVLLNSGDFRKISVAGNFVSVGAGVRLIELINFALNHNLGGMSSLVGIPGAIGGSVIMNAGVASDVISNHIFEIFGLYNDGKLFYANHDEINWSYRHTSIPHDVILTGAIFRLKSIENIDEEQALITTELNKRREREPKGRTAGCMFKNISPTLSAGKLIDLAGLKGQICGGAMISHEHANYIVNFDHATERDIIDLMVMAQKAVAEKFHLYLKSEVYFMNESSLNELENSVVAPKVLVLKGGVSNEREVSLRSGSAIANALRNANYQVTELDINECRLYPEMLECDVVYIGLHGGFGENGEIQKVLEDNKIKFVGSSSRASKLVMDKILSKELATSLNIPTAKWVKITRANSDFPAELKLPVVVKVPNEGSTFGVEIVKTIEEYNSAVEREFALAEELLVEEFIQGVEITVPIIIDRPLTAIEIHSPNGFYDYDAKYVYNKGKTEYFCPVKNATAESVNAAQKYSLDFFKAAKCKDILRVDFIISDDGTPYFLEANNLPGSTATSLVPKSANYEGISFEELVSMLVSRQL